MMLNVLKNLTLVVPINCGAIGSQYTKASVLSASSWRAEKVSSHYPTSQISDGLSFMGCANCIVNAAILLSGYIC